MINRVTITPDCPFAGSDSYYVAVEFPRGALDKLIEPMSKDLDCEIDVTVGDVTFQTIVTWGDEEPSEQAFFGGITSDPDVHSFAVRRFADHDKLTLSVAKDFEGDSKLDGTLWLTAEGKLPDSHWILPAKIIRNILTA